MTSDLAIIYVLAAFTLLAVLVIGLYQRRRVTVAKKRNEHSAHTQQRSDYHGKR